MRLPRGDTGKHFRVSKKASDPSSKGDPGDVIARDYDAWYGQLFGPSVTAGIIKASDLAGFRSAPVFIRRSMHAPPNHEAVRELMPAFFDHLRTEPEPAVRATLGHFAFVYIHPYMDGNGTYWDAS